MSEPAEREWHGMTSEAAKALAERMKTGEAFREKVLAHTCAEERAALANAQGYACDDDEIAPAVSGALSDEEMAWLCGAGGPSEEEPWGPGHYPIG